MPHRVSFLVALLSVVAAVSLVGWWRQVEQQRPDVNIHPQFSADEQPGGVVGYDDWYPDLPEQTADPAVAVETILDIRQHFGSVLQNSELGLVEPAAVPGNDDQPTSFDDFLHATAGLPAPRVAAADTAEGPIRVTGQLTESLREMALLLELHAQSAESVGDLAQQQRFTGLALLLAAEADSLAAGTGEAGASSTEAPGAGERAIGAD